MDSKSQSQSQFNPELVRALTEEWDSPSNRRKRTTDSPNDEPSTKKTFVRGG